jgi:hypothetical protein
MARSGLSSEELHPFDLYCLRWKRRNGSDEFRHCVRAQSMTDAMSRSREDISLALGSNGGLWRMGEPHQFRECIRLGPDGPCRAQRMSRSRRNLIQPR